MIRVITLILILSFGLFGKYLTFQEVHNMPKGLEKNYYIWRYIQQKNTSKASAMKIIKEATRINNLLRKAYVKKTGLKPPRVSNRGGISSSSKPPKQVDPNLQRKLAKTKEMLKSPNPLKVWKNFSPSMKVFSFNNAGRAGRKKLDHTPTLTEWQAMSRVWGVDKVVSKIRKENLKRFQKALYFPPAKDAKIGYSNLMKIGFESLQRGNKKVAELDFEIASRMAWAREQADRALFWAWKVSKNRNYLKKLVKSYSINIYTLAGRDALGMSYDLGITPKLPKGKVKGFDIKDPIAWHNLKRKIYSKGTNLKALAQRFKVNEAVGIYSYIMTRASKDRTQYFPMPYREYLSKFPIKRQAIIYAIARQESKFVPASVSVSYALGMMQIMPFLIKHLAKQKKELVDYDDMFNPKLALKYGNQHLNYLTSWLHHPLFVAYAYNAGIGYTRKLLRKSNFFRSNSDYEPWFSLERVANYQANDYGKKVLANYVIYLNKLGYHIKLTDLINSLTNVSITDRFRKQRR